MEDKKQNPGNKKPYSRSGGSNQNKDKKPFNFYWIYAIVGVVLISINLINFSGTGMEISPSKFEEYVKAGDIEKVVIINEKKGEVYLNSDALTKDEHKSKTKAPIVTGAKSSGPQYYFEVGPWKESIAADLKAWHNEYGIDYNFKTEEYWGRELLQWFLFLAIMIGLWMFFMRRIGGGGGAGGQIFNIGKSKATLFDKGKSTNINFNDVAGLEGAKEEVEEIVDFLKNPDKYTALGAKIPKGALLIGPPGTGKTLLAKAVAGEAQVPFFSLSGSDFVEMFVGVGASRVRDLFKQAKEKAPSIIFIDEIDAIGRSRSRGQSFGSNDERENTLNQLLTEMDGFGTNSGVIILAATNRVDILDRALLRAGRFDRQIFVDIPDLNERKEIFEVHLKPIKINDTVSVDLLARQTPGFTGADIANICNEAALIAARSKKKSVGRSDFNSAIDRIVGGLEKKNKLITKKEKTIVAFHEAGHATTSWLLRYAHPLVKVTIVPRGRSLGAAWYLPEERQITTAAQMFDEMVSTMGGRAAEKVVFGEISTGALSDLEKVTKQAYNMVTVYGLNEKIGNISFYDSSGQSEYNFTKPYSEFTAQIIDEEVKKIIEKAYGKAIDILTQNKVKLVKLAEKLLEEEVIFKEDLLEIFGERPFEDEIREEQESIKKLADERKAKAKERAKEEEQAMADEKKADEEKEKLQNNLDEVEKEKDASKESDLKEADVIPTDSDEPKPKS